MSPITTAARPARASRIRATAYTGPSDRDRRIDILRGTGLTLLAIEVVAYIVQPSAPVFESTATVSAVALVVATEAALIGMLHRPRLAAGGLGEATLRLWRRARAWYVAGLVLTLGVLLAQLIPALDLTPVTALPEEAQGRPWLFAPPPADVSSLVLGYPLDPRVFLDVLLLRVGPWPFDVAALLCVLFLVTPLLLRALARGRWLVLLVISVALYLAEIFSGLRLLPTRAEATLPVLGWQALFVVGLLAGYYRRELVQWFRHGFGLVLFWILMLASAVWLALPLLITLQSQFVMPDVLAAIASSTNGWLFEASAPGPLRLAVALVLMLVSYGLLTAVWRPLNLLSGWLLSPLGASALPSLIVLVATAVALSVASAALEFPGAVAVLSIAVIATMWLAAVIRGAVIRKAARS